jgi:predicted transposase/invertase (TIGR01784 family)
MENIQPHDWFFKQIFSNPKSVETVLDIFAPDLAKEVQQLNIVNTEKFSKKSKKFMLDLLYTCKVKDQEAFIRLIFEHKSYIDYDLPSQLLHYNAVIWQETAKEKQYYPPIINIFLYHGERKWNISTTLPVLSSKNLEKYSLKLNYLLIDLNQISDEDLKNRLYQDVCTISALLVMKHIFEDIQNFKPIFKLMIEYKSDCLYLAFDYIVLVKKDIEKVEEVLKEVIGGDEKMMTLTEKWKMEGWMKGKLEGKMEGKMEAKMEYLIKLTQLKFGTVPENLEKIIKQCKEIEELDEIFTKVALAKSIEELENIK